MKTHQIRCTIGDEGYQNLKKLSKSASIDLKKLAGLILSGYQITKQEKKE